MKFHKILAVDDNKDVLEQVVKSLEDDLFRIVFAPNGKIAVELAIKKQPDLILMDWIMPVQNGIEALIDLKANERTKNIPVIMLTSHTEPEDLQLAMELGASDYIQKPFRPVELLARVKNNIRLVESYNKITQLRIERLEHQNTIKTLKNKELANEVEAKSKILKTTALNLTQKSELFSKVLRNLQDLVSDKKISHHKLTNLIRDLNKMRETDVALKDFSIELENLNHELLAHIKKLYPVLGETELRICSMISLGLTNKEISDLLFLSIRTIESHRYHIGKKIKLPKGTNLKKLLMQIEKTL